MFKKQKVSKATDKSSFECINIWLPLYLIFKNCVFMKKVCFGLLMGVFMISCSSQKKCANKPDCLANTTWELQMISQDGKQLVVSETVPTLTFTEKGEVNGFAGCNQYFGAYKVDENGISIMPSGSTKAFCQDVMELEDAFLRGLADVKNYTLTENSLELNANTRNLTIQFVKK